MSITRLQQARQMYAMGQRVGGIMGSNAGSMLVTPTRDGSRPGYYGPDAGHENDPGHGSNAPGGNGDNRENYISNQYKNLPTPTVTVGVDKFDKPIEIKTTYTDKRARQQMLNALNEKGISAFDPRVTRTINPFDMSLVAQPKQNKFGLKNIAKNLLISVVAPQLLGKKFVTGMNIYNKAKTISNLAEKFNLTDKNVIESFTSNLTDSISGFGKGKPSTKGKDDDTPRGGGGDGIASLENQAGSYDEYILLLQKLQSGNISDSERNRFNVLKNMLGI
tara:strand:- start:101 stop:931 length:831 start_codon:yes stop_codon:yes gene_type:complete